MGEACRQREASDPPSAPAAALRRGDVLADRYRIRELLGSGGTGFVVGADNLATGQLVAIKMLLPDRNEPELVARLVREARIATSLRTEHVARLLDMGTLPSGTPFLVFERLIGSDLGDVLEARGALRIEEAVGYALEACEALAEAHRAGIVHRDIKPENLFLARYVGAPACLKVIDFGIARAPAPWADSDPSLTETRAIMGSPAYMSPEQLRSTRDVDARTDLWSLGVVLFELVTGRVPFEGSSFADRCVSILTGTSVPLRCLVPEAPPGLEAAIERCLRKDPRERFADALELAYALEPFAT